MPIRGPVTTPIDNLATCKADRGPHNGCDMCGTVFSGDCVPAGEWTGIRAETNYGPDGIGVTLGTLFDETGPVGAIQQSVLVRPR